MQLNKTKTLIGLILIFNISFGALCGRSTRATIATATDDFAEAQISTANLLANAKSTGLVSQEDINEIKPFLMQANDLNARAIEYGKQLSKNPNDVETRDKLINILNNLTSVLVRANNAGLIRIKDLKTRTAFNALVLTMQSAATSILGLVRR